MEASSFAEFEILEFEILRFDCMFYANKWDAFLYNRGGRCDRWDEETGGESCENKWNIQ